MKFKRGDKVRVIMYETRASHYQGMVGVVKGFSTSKFYLYEVQFSDCIGIFAGYELEKVE